MFNWLKRKIPNEVMSPINFGYNSDWFAIKNVDSELIVDFIKQSTILRSKKEVISCSWDYGINEIIYGTRFSRNRIFITPQIKGWTLVATRQINSPEDLKQILINMSSHLKSTVCYFGCQDNIDFVAYSKAIEGDIKRLYFCVEDIHLEIGSPTAEEVQLNLRYKSELNNTENADQEDSIYEHLPNSNTVLKLAELWSVNPNSKSWIEEGPSLCQLL